MSGPVPRGAEWRPCRRHERGGRQLE